MAWSGIKNLEEGTKLTNSDTHRNMCYVPTSSKKVGKILHFVPPSAQEADVYTIKMEKKKANVVLIKTSFSCLFFGNDNGENITLH